MTEPQNMAAAAAVAGVMREVLAPLVIAGVLTFFTWMVAMTWMTRSTKQAVDSLTNWVAATAGKIDAQGTALETHRIEDAAHFAQLKERSDLLHRVLEYAEARRRPAEDRAGLSS